MSDAHAPALHFENLRISVADQEIVSGVSLTIQPGEIHAIMGPNGSGKSSLAAAIAGHPAYAVQSGSILTLENENLLELSPDERARKGLFLAFQYPTEIPGVSVYNFLRALWEARFGPVKDNPHKKFTTLVLFKKHILKIAETLAIEPELLERNVNEGFSGGERKRIEILQMALFAPKIAVLDETDSGLDIDALKIVALGAQKIAQENSTGLLLITHYQRILQFLQPGFVHVMVHGKFVAHGGPELAEKLENNGYAPYLGE